MNETVNTAAAAAVTAAPSLGFGHFLTQTDAVARFLLVVLVVMSVASWALIVSKSAAQWLRRSRGEKFLRLFWNATSLEAVQHEIATHGVRDPFAEIVEAQDSGEGRVRKLAEDYLRQRRHA